MNKDLKKKIYSNLKKLQMDQRGQVDLIGNLLDFVKTQPVLMVVIFLVGLYVSTWELEIFPGFKIGIGLFVGGILEAVFDIAGFHFDWKLFVIFCFVMALVGLTLVLHK